MSFQLNYPLVTKGSASNWYSNVDKNFKDIEEEVNKINAEMSTIARLNLIINGSLRVWQRGTSFISPNNAYATDRMKCNGTGTVSKHANGMQIIGTINLRYIMEDLDYNAIAGKTVTLSYSKDNTVITQTFIATSSTVINLDLANCIINWFKLEIGDKAAPFVPRLYAEELALCMRYYEHNYSGGVKPGTVNGLSNAPFVSPMGSNLAHLPGADCKVEKRVVPTVTIYGPSSGAVNGITQHMVGAIAATATGVIISNATSGFGGIVVSPALTAGITYTYNWTADAEIY